jgi:hypothetical protein
MSSGIEVKVKMIFSCFYHWEGGERESWTGKIDYIHNYGGHYEIFILSRSSIRVFIGKSSRGIFACMPDFHASCHLSSPNDVFYNKEKLIYAMDNAIDGATIAYALEKLKDVLKF